MSAAEHENWAGADDERALTPLAPNHVKLLRVQAAIVTAPFVIGSLVLETADLLPTGLFVAPVLAAAAWVVLRIPLRRHAARGYDLGADRLRVVRGLWFRSDTVVPFGRVQHIDVTQGPLERGFGLSTLVVHTAGTHNASVALPGLAADDAAAMRETIRAHIKREML
ncbi:PH domain-containing protein [Tsuneonella sp. SYSU-LHT278]|uniref:PH domain-containing protein n=1 Tax=Tsuneonella sediminis TaxID=3416089 RepID=UPI003F7AD46F